MAKLALLIGVSHYGEGFNPLPAAPRDVEALREVLKDADLGGFEIFGPPLINPDAQEMREVIESFFNDCKKDDLLLFYYSGHGVQDKKKNLYLAASTTCKHERDKLKTSTAVSASRVRDWMSDSPSREQIVILDCCFSGGFAEGLLAKSLKKQVVLTSSSAFEYSLESEDEDSELSIYTRYLVEGIKTGEADANKDGIIDADELSNYVSQKVQEAPHKMTPQIIAVGQGDKLPLALAVVERDSRLEDRIEEELLREERKSDPKLEYRKAVEKIASNGQISPPDRSILDQLREQLGLLPEEADKIEDEVLQDYQEYESNKQRYENWLRDMINVSAQEGAYYIDDDSRKKMQSWQQVLGLQDKDVASICYNVGTDLQKQSKLNEAINLYKEATRLDVILAEAYTRWGDALFSQSQIGEALTQYENAIRLKPSLAEARKGLGDVLCTQRQLEKAVSAYQKAISLDKDYAEAYRGWGDALYYQEGKLEEAIAKYEKAIEIDKNNARAYDSLANAFEDIGKSKKKIKKLLKKARETYEEAIKQNENDAEALAGLGVVISRQNNNSYSDEEQEEAALKCQQAIELNPDNAMAYYGWGEALRKQDNEKEAIDKYEAAIVRNPYFCLAYKGLAKVMMEQSKWKKAIGNLQKAIKLKPNDTKLRPYLVKALEEKDKFKEAIAACEEHIRVCPENDKWQWYKKMGDLLSGQDQLDKAITSYEAAIKLNSRDAYLHNSLGDALYKQKKMGEAAVAFCKAISLMSRNIRFDRNYINALYKDGQYEATVYACKEAIKKYPRDANLYNMLGNGLYGQKKMSEAEYAYREAIKIWRNSSVFHNNLGKALYEQNKLSEAIDEYKKAIRINPNNPSYYNNFGCSYYRLNKQDDAIVAYRKAVNLNPQNAVFYENLGNALWAQGKQQEARAALAKSKDLYKANGNDNKANEIAGTLFQMDGYETLNQVGNNVIKWLNNNFK